MLDINFIRENPEAIKENILRRGVDPKKADVDRLLVLDKHRRLLTTKIEQLRHERTEAAEKRDIERGRKLKEGIKSLEDRLEPLVKEWQSLMDWVPNLSSPKMPIGNSAADDVELSAWPTPNPQPKFAFPSRNYHDLMVALDLVDMEKAAKNSGSRFYYLKNEAVLLQFAIFNHALQKLVKRGFTPITTPCLVKRRPLYGTGYFPSEGSQIYRMFDQEKIEDKEELYLVGTSEQAIVAYHADEIIKIDDMHPLRYVGYSECFRSEAGSWGKETKGIKRVHQFAKVEMIYFTTPETSERYMLEALAIEEEILQDLKLPYRVIDMCTGDVGAATYRKFDVETWLPGVAEYCEVMSNSDLATYHSRRLNIRYHDAKTNSKRYVHTISATAITNTRPIISIIDNYQQPDGAVEVPAALQDYVGKKLIEPKI